VRDRLLKDIQTKALDTGIFLYRDPVWWPLRGRCFKGNLREKEGFIYQETFFTGEFRRYVKQNMWKNNALYRGSYDLLKGSLKRGLERQKRIVGKRCVYMGIF